MVLAAGETLRPQPSFFMNQGSVGEARNVWGGFNGWHIL
jgi:hypothetical protein